MKHTVYTEKKKPLIYCVTRKPLCLTLLAERILIKEVFVIYLAFVPNTDFVGTIYLQGFFTWTECSSRYLYESSYSPFLFLILYLILVKIF
jgi:hypothetical protein